MTNSQIDWTSLLDSRADASCSLKAALLTTYDRPDARLLAEDVLPELLRLDRRAVSEGSERGYFLSELDQQLKLLHDKIVVVSSTAFEEPIEEDDDARREYGWIWRSVRHLTVGRNGRAVQHAKLWLLHWQASDADSKKQDRPEFLELVVSSANLTRSAFRGQIQAAWRALIPLETKPVHGKSWGVLPAFLVELAKSSGAEQPLNLFIDLLTRAKCPADTTFVASVPGSHTSQTLKTTPWGVAGLSRIALPSRGPVIAKILSPFVGSWNEGELKQWCGAFEGVPKGLELAWIDTSHRWANKWLLPASTLQSLKEEKCTILQLHDSTGTSDDHATTFHDEHKPQHDRRWSHAKVYFFKRGNSRRMLVTSANFSPAAWGRKNYDGELVIENFELGVCINQANWPFEQLAEFADWESIATVSELPARVALLITWAQAKWDGKLILINCRCEAREQLNAVIRGGQSYEITHWTKAEDGCLRASVPWNHLKGLPSSVELSCVDQTVIVPVFDARQPQDRWDTAPPELDPNEAQAMRDALLFERYGGPVADDVPKVARSGEVIPFDDDSTEDGSSGRSDNYDVLAFVQARRHSEIVDNWAGRTTRAHERNATLSDIQTLREDGQRLYEAFTRLHQRDNSTNSIGAKIAADELKSRLKHFGED